ncbi:hypothetical protein NDU88_000432 [Pleurodeles waltl]|uniref:Uncharacterized protein n=1 Tax=Pleurodeles waltl TaxID=8319 RepID=A0AAV7MI38_PLEWA|nr:hypothetical protein NDU88_000432 [Pleurodeles waltl]
MCGARPSRVGSRVTPCVAHGRAGWVPALLHVWRTAEQDGFLRYPMCGARLSRMGYPMCGARLSRMGYPMCGARPSRMGSRVTPCVAHG